ncbi:MAG: hypothetical protein OYH77_08105 [Pseudomonadota bacterium]|nr:hypothetical protein [Pseudomonadota bacterium]
MRHTFRQWLILVMLTAVGSGISATPSDQPSADTPTSTTEATVSEGEEESMSLSSLLREGSKLEEQIYTLLRSLKFPRTIGTAAISGATSNKVVAATLVPEIQQLDGQVKQWQDKASDFLVSSDDTMLQLHSVLPVLYFSLATKILQIRMLTGIYSSTAEEAPTLRVPVAMIWTAGDAFQNMLTKQLRVEWHDDSAVVSLREEFIADIVVGMAALNPSDDTHLQATKHVLYRTLYAQLLRNEYYYGEQFALPPTNSQDQLPERMRVLLERRGAHSQAQLVAAMHAVAPRVTMPEGGLEKPLHADKNWQQVLQLRADFPNLQTFTNTTLAMSLYPLIPAEHRTRLELTSHEDLEKFMTLGECLLFPNLLASAVKNLGFVVDGSEASNAALAQVLRKAKLSATISVLRELRIKDSATIQKMNVALLKRRDELKINGAAWYQAAVMFLPTFKEKIRNDFISDLVATAKRIQTIEELALLPVSLPVLNKSLWRSFHEDDFSGDFQGAIAEISQSKSYPAARNAYFLKLAAFLQRLHGKPFHANSLAKTSVNDIQAEYLLPMLGRDDATDDENLANRAISEKVDMHHVSQIKSLLLYGKWFGFFNALTTAPTIDDLPLTDAQKENYFLELKYGFVYRYPLLLIERDKKPLHQLLAADDFEDDEQRWAFIADALEQQYEMIAETIAKVDRAKSAADFKHLLAHSYPISAAMQEYAGLYPIHRQKTEKFSKPSQFWKDLEALDHKYVGSFFMALISLHLGDWLMGKHPSTRKLLRYTTALMRPNMLVVGYLATILFAGIIFEWLAVETFKVFVLAPKKLDTLYDYYEIGNANDKFLSRTLLDYIELEQKAQKLNYGFEGAMHGIFVGWFGYNVLIKRMLKPKLAADKTKKLLERIGITKTHQELATSFNRTDLAKNSKEQIAKLNQKIQEGVISELYGKEQIRQVKLAHRKLVKKVDKIERKIEIEKAKRGSDNVNNTEEEELLGAIIGRPLSTNADLKKIQEGGETIHLQDKLLNHHEALTLALLRKRAVAGGSSELRQALLGMGMPLNFFETTDPKHMTRIVRDYYQAKRESYRLITSMEERQILQGILGKHKVKLDDEIKKILQGVKR